MTLRELSRKDVICLKSGENLGRIDDLIFDESTAHLKAAVLHGRSHFCGLFGCDNDLIISWDKIKSIGADVVIADTEPSLTGHK